MASQDRPARARRRGLAPLSLGLGALAVVGVGALYLAHTGAHLVSDDWGVIAAIHSGADVLRDFVRPCFGHSACYYRPLASVSLGLDWFFWRLDPLVFHAVSLLLFAACAVAAGQLAARFSGGSRAASAWTAFLLCLAHPLAVEPVNWIANRCGVLSGLFVLVGCLAFVNWVSGGRRRHLVIAALAQAAALLSKEDALVLPALALVLAVRPGRVRRALLGAVGLAIPVAAWFAARVAAGVEFPAGGHASLASPDRWGGAVERASAHLRMLFLPHYESATVVEATATVVGAVGISLLVLFNARALVRGRTLRLALALLVTLLPALHTPITFVHGGRVLFLAVLFASVLLGAVAGRAPSAGSWSRVAAPVGLTLAAWLVLTASALGPWREAGELARRVAAAVHRLHDQLPPDRPFVFVDPPRHHRGVPVLDETLNSVLEPPFTARPRPLVSAWPDLAVQLLNRGPDPAQARAPHQVLRWRSGRGLTHAPAPRNTSPILWEGTCEDAVRAEKPGACVVRTGPLGVSPLVLDRIVVELRRRPDALTARLEIEGEGPSDRVAVALPVAPERIPGTGRHRLWIPLYGLDAVAGMDRVDRLAIGLDGAGADDVTGARIHRECPGLEAEADLMPDGATPGRHRLVIRIRGIPAGRLETFRVRIYRLRAPLAHFDVPAAHGERLGDGDVRVVIPIGERALRAVGERGGALFFRVEAYAGRPEPIHLRAASRPGVISGVR